MCCIEGEIRRAGHPPVDLAPALERRPRRERPWQPMRSMRRRRILDQRGLWTHRAGGSFMANGAAEALPWLRGTARLLRRATSRRCREGIRVARNLCVTSGHRGRTARSCALTCCIRDSRALGSRRLAARRSRWPVLMTGVRLAASVVAPTVASVGSMPLTISADRAGAIPAGHHWNYNDFFPRTLSVQRGSIIRFSIQGFRMAILLPAGQSA